MVSPTRIPLYLSHSYRPEDRGINRYYWDVFWDAGFTFTVDPKSSQQMCVPNLELMMQRSAGFVAIAPYRADEERYRMSPYIVFEHGMAVRAKKPRLVIAESLVAGHPFDGTPLSVFQRDDPGGARDLTRFIQDLKGLSAPLAERAGHVLGSVGLVLPPSRAYRSACGTIRDVLESAGYRVRQLRFDPTRPPSVAEIDRHDFFVIDIGAQGMTSGLYYRFVPTIQLGYRPGNGHDPSLLRPSWDEALERVGGTDQNVIWWSSEEQLLTQLRPLVDRMQRPRREFRTREEGIGYIQSLGRTLQGPVFISNARRQNDLAMHLSRALDLNNIRFFHYLYRNPIPLDTAWERQLLEHVRSSALFVALISADYWDSPLCQQEFQLAKQLSEQNRLRIYRYYLDDTLDVVGATERLQGRDLAGKQLEEQLGLMVGDIDAYLTVGQNIAS